MVRLSLSAAALAALFVPSVSAQGVLPCTEALYVLEGESAGDQFGWVSSPIPDVDGDGLFDLAVTAPSSAAGGTLAGRLYVYNGATGAELFRYTGAAQQRIGWSVRDAGDVDQDGTPDVIVGGRGGGVPGRAVVLSGATGLPIWEATRGGNGSFFGYAVSGAGDVDLDGVPDLAVGGIAFGSGNSTGQLVVLSGADSSVVLRTFDGEAVGDNFGASLARLADLNGDGHDELIAGATNAGPGGRGKAYVLDLQADAVLYDLEPLATGSSFGQFFVGSAGLVNADAIPDVYVSDFGDNGGRGRAYLFDGPTGATIRTLAGGVGDGFGIGRVLGDVNADGRDDMLLGSWTAGGGAGQLEVFSGLDGTRLRNITSTQAGEALGFDAHGLPDVDGDGLPELVGTAAQFASNRGRVLVITRRPIEGLANALAGSGGAVPRLNVLGCPRPGQSFSLTTSRVLGGAMGLLVIGLSRVDLPLLAGTLVPNLDYTFVHVVDGTAGVPEDGGATLTFNLPPDPNLVHTDLFVQSLYVDPAAPRGVSYTRGLRVTVY